jgi:hypothetical protein
VRLLNDLTLSRGSGALGEKVGRTCSDEASVAAPVEWELHLSGYPLLTVHDNHWANGERNLVLYMPTVVPEMPSALSKLHNRLRSGITASPKPGELRVMVYPAYEGGSRSLPGVEKGGRGPRSSRRGPYGRGRYSRRSTSGTEGWPTTAR